MNLGADSLEKQFSNSENGIDTRISRSTSEKKLIKVHVFHKVAVN